MILLTLAVSLPALRPPKCGDGTADPKCVGAGCRNGYADGDLSTLGDRARARRRLNFLSRSL